MYISVENRLEIVKSQFSGQDVCMSETMKTFQTYFKTH